MEGRKLKEIEYYDKEAKLAQNQVKELGNRLSFDPFLLESYIFLRDYFKRNCQNKKVLDYGCGFGMHLSWLSKMSSEIVGIDLSENSLLLAKEKIKKEGLADKVKILLADCENTGFA